jgi:hypothetical protein
MADNDAELRAALLAFCHAAREANAIPFESDEDFAAYVEHVVGTGRPTSGRAEGFRVHYMMYGRYPTFAEMHRPPKALIPEHF